MLIVYAAVMSGGVITYLWFILLNVPKRVYSRQLHSAVSNAVCLIDSQDIITLQKSSNPQQTDLYRKLEDKLLLVRQNAPMLEVSPKGKKVKPLVPMEKRRAIIIVKDKDKKKLKFLVSSLDTKSTLDNARIHKILTLGWQNAAAETDVVKTDIGPVMGAVAPIKDPEGNTVALLGLEMSVDYFREISMQMIVSAITIFILAVSASTFIAFWISRRLSKPMKLLADGMEEIAKGNSKAYITPIKTGDEFEQLIDQYNTMLDVLDERNKMKKSLELARQIQQHLLPKKMPMICGYDISGTSVYCDETGGDYYDFLRLDDNTIAAVIGDITGHGIGAAMLMAAARGVLRSNAPQYKEDLCGLFKVMNTHLLRDTGEDRFMTLFYCKLECDKRKVQWISGGHDPALLYRADIDKFEQLSNSGIPLGILTDAEYTSNDSLILNPGDILVAGTDGIWEAGMKQKKMFGKERMKKIIRDSKDLSAKEIQDKIINAVIDFIGYNPRQDDITLFIIKSVE